MKKAVVIIEARKWLVVGIFIWYLVFLQILVLGKCKSFVVVAIVLLHFTGSITIR